MNYKELTLDVEKTEKALHELHCEMYAFSSPPSKLFAIKSTLDSYLKMRREQREQKFIDNYIANKRNNNPA